MDAQAVETLFSAIKERYNYSYDLNEKQLKVVASLLSGKDTFCVLPTGFGKSDCFILPPLLLEEVRHMCFQDLINVGIHTAGDTKHSFVFLSLFFQSD